MPTVHRELAHAKLTRSLAVTGVRDDGYHLLRAEMVTLDLDDELEISPVGEGGPSRLEVVDAVEWLAPGGAPAGLAPAAAGGAAAGLAPAAGAAAVPSDGSNLVLRALAAAGRSASVRLVKRIPAAAGLGGGSADAAAVLRWAGVLDPAVAVTIGADVPFCVVGGRALVTGIGDELSVLPPVELHVVLVTPRLAVPTALVYKAWDAGASAGGAAGGRAGGAPNDLEAPALEVEPRLVWWRDLLRSVAGRAPVLAGSGSTWFFECADAAAAAVLAGELRGAVVEAGEPAMVRACRTVAGA